MFCVEQPFFFAVCAVQMGEQVSFLLSVSFRFMHFRIGPLAVCVGRALISDVCGQLL